MSWEFILLALCVLLVMYVVFTAGTLNGALKRNNKLYTENRDLRSTNTRLSILTDSYEKANGKLADKLGDAVKKLFDAEDELGKLRKEYEKQYIELDKIKAKKYDFTFKNGLLVEQKEAETEKEPEILHIRC